MAHRHYHTEGFITGRVSYRERDALLSIFTRELGFVRASVRSVRTLVSKLRPHASKYNYVDVSLVRGKDFWRVVSLETRPEKIPWHEPQSARPSARVFALLERLLTGEEPAPGLFDDVRDGLLLFDELPKEGRGELAKTLECLIVLRILYHLGYLSNIPLVTDFVVGPPLDLALVYSLLPLRSAAVSVINQSFNDASI